MGSCFSSSGSRSPLPSPASSIGKKRKTSMKKHSSSFHHSWKEDQLHRIPGRRFLNGSSEVASLFTQQGRKGNNQDAMLVWENFGSRKGAVFCGIFDGHGPYGHMVAKRVRDSLPLKLSALLEVSTKSDDVPMDMSLSTKGSINSESASFLCTDEVKVHTSGDIFQTLKESFLTSFSVMDLELKTASIDSFSSGTTAVTLVRQGHDLVIGNVGDSRAILGTRDKGNSIIAVQLTVDLKPNLPAEAERIQKCKGRVFALHDEPEVTRVWLPNADFPGLAMARAFGDFCLKDFGLISVPEVSYRRLTAKDEFVILATDGIWDVLSNEEVVEIVDSASARSSAAKVVVEAAIRSWRNKHPASKVDDCAVVCLFLDDGADSASNEKVNGVHNHEKVAEEWSSDIQGVSRSDTILTSPRALQENGTKPP
ncbi:unnamed protein product [Cuscuta epithymum]|uniref:PPM-type phosphatase domain-containing protein n=1 Tax=Cuscuta epithymum TaxID=186058 RepID=A0AAV0EJ11_9ASTE|nr:unnamed protein product [Cuscuta epithymum]